MLEVRACVAAVVLNVLFGVSSGSVTVGSSFISNIIVPEVIPVPPTELLSVTYSNEAIAKLGNELTPTQAQKAPAVAWNATAGQYYTLIMTDPDAPSRTNASLREWQHWIVGNIPGTNVSAGEVLSQYVGAGPGAGSGLHRYVFLVYKQPSNLTFDEPRLNNTSAFGRDKFTTTLFAKKHHLGDPVAGNFFQSQYDDYVPKLLEQLGLVAPTTTTAAPTTVAVTVKPTTPTTITAKLPNPNPSTSHSTLTKNATETKTSSSKPNSACSWKSGVTVFVATLVLYYVR